MSRFKGPLVLVFFVGALLAVGAWVWQTQTQVQPTVSAMFKTYSSPTPVFLRFDKIDPPTSADSVLELKATITPQMDNLKAATIYFESSQDLTVEPKETRFPVLNKSDKQEIVVKVGKGTGQAFENEPWVRLGISFTPDYKALKALFADKAKYPDAAMADLAIRTLAESEKKNELDRYEIMYFLNSPQHESLEK